MGAQVAQQQRRLGVAPVEVVDEEQHGAASDAVRTKDATESARRYRSVSGSAFTGAGSGPTMDASSGTMRQLPRTVAERLGWSRRPELADVVQDRLDEGLVRPAQPLLHPAGEQDPGLLQHVMGQLRDEAGLADPRLAADEDDLRHAAAHRVPDAGEPCTLVGPATERNAPSFEEAREARRRPGRLEPRPVDPVAVDGFGDALQRERTDRRERDAGARAGEPLHGRRGEDLTGVAVGAQARGLHHRDAEVVAVLEPHVARRQPDAHVHRRLGRVLVVALVEGLLHEHGRLDRVVALAKTAMQPSPRNLTTRPRLATTASVTSVSWMRRRRSARSSPREARRIVLSTTSVNRTVAVSSPPSPIDADARQRSSDASDDRRRSVPRAPA